MMQVEPHDATAKPHHELFSSASLSSPPFTFNAIAIPSSTYALCPTETDAVEDKQQSSHSIRAAPPLSSCLSSFVLDNKDLVEMLASFLCHGLSLVGPVLDSSLIELALCSRRTHSLLMKDAPCWKRQPVYLKLSNSLVSLDRWARLTADDDMLALRVDGFGSRQQRVMRRLLGAEVYEREVAGRLGEVREVAWMWCDSFTPAMEAVGLTLNRHCYDKFDIQSWRETTVAVYPQLTPAFFDSLTHHLPAHCQLYVLGEPVYKEYRDPDNEQYNAPHCQWLLGSWDAVLLPRWTQWVVRAHIDVTMLRGLPQPYQTACLLHALGRLPSLQLLSLRWTSGQRTQSQLQNHPAILSLSELTDVLPRLTSLHISRMPLFPSFIESLLASSSLQRLQLEDTPVYGLQSDELGLTTHRALRYDSDLVRSVERIARELRGERGNLRVRVALYAAWDEALQETMYVYGEEEHLLDMEERSQLIGPHMHAEAVALIAREQQEQEQDSSEAEEVEPADEAQQWWTPPPDALTHEEQLDYDECEFDEEEDSGDDMRHRPSSHDGYDGSEDDCDEGHDEYDERGKCSFDGFPDISRVHT